MGTCPGLKMFQERQNRNMSEKIESTIVCYKTI